MFKILFDLKRMFLFSRVRKSFFFKKKMEEVPKYLYIYVSSVLTVVVHMPGVHLTS